ncbi:Crp/Fnr family transcriptional regulator [Aureispira anguillae]|uniref:Crp/Fnr family transcriptional regulator n=1 Tax=Aureispira anguillae TaxID=2864201 RepID=A0A915YDZ7_9BACT|nr:Crp/Fnr family transcriptional regulator [Aureispira anguillae]BDS11375.1 Crp/Fnr family transcriptional regulator [Aureispira anguillae]
MATIQKLIEELERYGKTKKFKLNDTFIREGQIPNKIGIVKKGLFRYYYLTSEGKEFTKVFMKEGAIISSYSSMILGTKSIYTIEALEASNVIEISYHQWVKLREEDNKWDKLLISFLEKGYRTKEKREQTFLLMDAEHRYKEFLLEYPNLEQRVKQYMVASYLGITPIALSRIRKKMKRINLC